MTASKGWRLNQKRVQSLIDERKVRIGKVSTDRLCGISDAPTEVDPLVDPLVCDTLRLSKAVWVRNHGDPRGAFYQEGWILFPSKEYLDLNTTK